jgi:hypothetical protein
MTECRLIYSQAGFSPTTRNRSERFQVVTLAVGVEYPD